MKRYLLVDQVRDQDVAQTECAIGQRDSNGLEVGKSHKSMPQGIISWAGNSIAQNVSPSGHRAYRSEQHLLSAKSSCMNIRSEARADPKEVWCADSWCEEHDCRLIHQSYCLYMTSEKTYSCACPDDGSGQGMNRILKRRKSLVVLVKDGRGIHPPVDRQRLEEAACTGIANEAMPTGEE